MSGDEERLRRMVEGLASSFSGGEVQRTVEALHALSERVAREAEAYQAVHRVTAEFAAQYAKAFEVMKAEVVRSMGVQVDLGPLVAAVSRVDVVQGKAEIEQVSVRSGALTRDQVVLLIFLVAFMVALSVVTDDALQADGEQIKDRLWDVSSSLVVWAMLERRFGAGQDHG